MSPLEHLAFIACAVLATVAQSVSGFALGLLLIGMVEVFGLAPLADVSVAVSILTCINALFTLRPGSPRLPAAQLRPLLLASLLCVPLGALALTLLAKGEVAVLKLALGVLVLLSSLTLLLPARPGRAPSPGWAFWATGSATGVLSGMFATGGPPLVHLLYRQPTTFEHIRNTLVLVFTANAALRIVVLLLFGGITRNALLLTAECVPVIMLLSHWLVRHPIRLPPRATRLVVVLLLLIAGASLVGHGLLQLNA